jgi:hypothetical protein
VPTIFSHREFSYFLFFALALALTLGCDRSAQGIAKRPAPPTTVPAGGQAKMVALLDDIARRTPDENQYLGTALARELTAQLDRISKNETSENRMNLLSRLGNAELNVGDTRKAIAHLSEAYHLLDGLEVSRDRAWYTIYRLGIAYMRLGETENCCLRYQPESCIIPIQGGGVHTEEEGSRRAVEFFQQAAELYPPDAMPSYAARWLLNVSYMTLGEYPDKVPEAYLIPASAFAPKPGRPRFKNISSALGLDTFNNAGGAIVDDFDGDNYLDVMTSSLNVNDPISFFKNNGDGTFSDRASEAGLKPFRGGLNLIQGDYDNDGDLDVLVLRGGWFGRVGHHPNSLLQNQGNAVFVDVTFEAGLGHAHYPTQTAAWMDYDNDGDLDLYVGNEMIRPRATSNRPQGASRAAQSIVPSQLFRNNADGTFTDVAEQAGVQNLRFTKGVTCGDYNGDGYTDVYLSNFGDDNRLYKNNGNGTFTDVAPELGVKGPIPSFPVWFWDHNNDGALDLFVSTYTADTAQIGAHYMGVKASTGYMSLYEGDGRGNFFDVAGPKGLHGPMLAMGANFGDIDNDGFLDFYLGTGDPDFGNLHPNLMFWNRAGKAFEDVTMDLGMGHLQKGHGVSFADIDNDGDLDVFEQMGGAYFGDRFNDALYRNPGFGNHWISLRLEGVQSNRSAFGARIHLVVAENGKPRSIYRTVGSGGSFGCNPLRQTIGIGRAAKIERIEILWPTTGKTQVFTDVKLDQAVHVVEGHDRLIAIKRKVLSL